LIEQIEMGMIYVNVHTDDGVGAANTGPGDFADGEIRGQVQLRSASNGHDEDDQDDEDDDDEDDDEEDDDEEDDDEEDDDEENEEEQAFATRLSGDEEVPPRDTDARGKAEIKLSDDGTELEYKIEVSRIENVVAAHLHLGTSGMNGDIVATLFGPVEPGGGRENGRLARGAITAEDLEGPLAGQPLSALIEQIEAGMIYVNVHTDDGVGEANTGPGDFADGEIRGQVELRSASRAAAVDAFLASWNGESLGLDWKDWKALGKSLGKKLR
jgi:hypothetical protein